jgi:hypothetical protein
MSGKREKKQRNGMDTILMIVGLFVFAFVVTMIIIYCIKGAVPDTLIQYVLGGGGLEALLLAGIKIAKIRNGGNHDESDTDS